MKLVYPTTANFIYISSHFEDFFELRAVKKSFKKIKPLEVRSITAPENFPNIANSDQVSYWTHNFPAVMVTDTRHYRNKSYNTANDTVEKLSYQGMAMVVQGLYQTVVDFEKANNK